MKTHLLIVTLLGTTLLLSGCQLFQTVEEPIALKSTVSAQEIVSQAVAQLYDIHSGKLIEKYDLALYHNDQESDGWKVTIRENWHDNPDQSLAEIHLTLSLPELGNPNKTTQGIVNLSTARDGKMSFGKINDVHFAGPDGHLLDEQLQPWTEQWFSLPQSADVGGAWQWLISIMNLPAAIKSSPADIIQKGKYFTVLDETNVQTDEEQAYQYRVILDRDGILQVINQLEQIGTHSDIWAIAKKLLASSSFDGHLLIGKESHAPKQLSGTLTIQSPVSPAQKIVLHIHQEITDINAHVPVAVPNQFNPLPTALLNNVSPAEEVLE